MPELEVNIFNALVYYSTQFPKPVSFRLGLQGIGLLFMPHRFPESGKKNAPEYEYLHEA